MSWLGKLLGGTVGFVLGGPLGSVGGAALGHFLMDTGAKEADDSDKQLNETEHQQAVFFITTFSLLAKLAKADGVICREEKNAVDHLMTDVLKMDDKARNFAKQIFFIAKNADCDFDGYAKQFYDNFSHQPRMFTCLIDLLLRVAAADGKYHEKEERLILKAVLKLGMDKDEYEFLKHGHLDAGDRDYAILRCKPEDSPEVIDDSYRRLIDEYQPENIVGKGLPPEFIDFSRQKCVEIEEAYQSIKK